MPQLPQVPEQIRAFQEHFSLADGEIYLNAAAITPLSKVVRGAIERWMRMAAKPYFPYRHILQEATSTAAQLLHTTEDRIFFSKSTTHGIQQFILGYPWRKGDEVLLASCEFPANRYPWLHLRKRGVTVQLYESDTPIIELSKMLELCTSHTRVIAISWVQYLSGQRISLQQLGHFCRQRDLFLVVDAIQGLGVVPLDVGECKIDWLSAEGQKWLCAPEGTGIVYVSPRAQEVVTPPSMGWTAVKNAAIFDQANPQFLDSAFRYHDGSHNTLGIIALTEAIKLLLRTGIPTIHQYIQSLISYAFNRFLEMGIVPITPRHPAERAGILSIPLPENKHHIVARLEAQGVSTALRQGCLRLSPQAYITPENMNNALDLIIKQLSE